MKLVSSTLLVFASLTSVAQIFEKIESKDANERNGVYYALPKSILTVEIPITRITRTAGEFMNYLDDIDSMKYLWSAKIDGVNRLKKKKLDKIIYYELGDISLSSYPVPDLNKLYFAKVNRNIFRSRELNFVLNDLGSLNSAQFVDQDRTFDIIVQGVTSIAGIAGALVKGPAAPKVISPTDRAESLLKALVDVRTSRYSIIKTPVPGVTGTALTKYLSELDKLDASIVEQFTYGEKKKTFSYKLDILLTKDLLSEKVTPLDSLTQNVMLFKFDSANSVFFYKAAYGDYTNLYLNEEIKFVATKAVLDENSYYLNLYVANTQMSNRISNSSNKAGLPYNIPAKTQVKIVHSTKIGPDEKVKECENVCTSNLMMPQFGTVAYLNAKLSSSNIELDPQTGALRTLKEKMEGLTADQIKAAGSAFESTAGLRKSDTTRLKEEATRLELQEKILKTKLSIDSLTNK